MTKILIAEDERDIRELVSFSLQFGGFIVIQAANGAEAVERAQAEKPDLILMDVPMHGNALLDFTSDRLRILPFRGDPAATSATVRTLVKRDGGTEVPVNYTLRATPQGWKAWDVTIEGISYVKNFQTDFGAEINDKGLEHLIQRLESQGLDGAAPAKDKG